MTDLEQVERAARETADDTLSVEARLVMYAFADRLAKVIAKQGTMISNLVGSTPGMWDADKN